LRFFNNFRNAQQNEVNEPVTLGLDKSSKFFSLFTGIESSTTDSLNNIREANSELRENLDNIKMLNAQVKAARQGFERR
jgi:hypothetical protein